MHMADALISPVVGGTMMAATACVAAYSIKKVQNDLDDKKVPIMGVMGAFSVVLETLLSGKTELPFNIFVLLMQPIHLGIGVVEGLVTAAVVTFVWKARPEILERIAAGETIGSISIKKVLAGILVTAIIIGGFVSWFASSNPDGLEWSMERTAGTAELEASGSIHDLLANIQSKTAFLPDYSFKTANEGETNIYAGTSVSGIVGGALTLGLAGLIGLIISVFKKKKPKISEKE
ncbi:hypothetical protein E9840_09495 [Tissierella creatinini]|nr:hypothetical protein E9840_09495 [Tissierella creatinini]TJX61384.1 hypothetical protein E8P77_18700 [Soehngenia saccharolytica]